MSNESTTTTQTPSAASAVDTEAWRLDVRLQLWKERLANQHAKLAMWQRELQSLTEIPNAAAASVNMMFAKHALGAALEDLG